jgi:apolipoprotein N-acyltransferase
MPLLLRLPLAALAGIGVAISFEPLALAYLLPGGVALLTLVLRGTTAGRGFWLGAVFGTTFMLVLLPWLQVIGADAWVLLSVVEGLFLGLVGLGTVLVQRLPWWPLWAATVWVAVEALRSSVPFGGFPWGRLAFATVDTPAAGLMAYVGAAGTTFVVALLGTSLAWAVVQVVAGAPVRGLAAVAAPALVVAAGGLTVPETPASAASADEAVIVAAVQGDVPGEGMNAFAERRAVLDNHVAATKELARRVEEGSVPAPDLVIWPENSTDIDPFTDPTVRADIQDAVDAVGVPVLVGAMVGGEDPSDVYNQGIVWEPGSGPGERYSKTHPVPFGEYIPLRDLFAPYIERLQQIPRDMVPGTEPGLLSMNGTTVGDVICFEIAYDDVVHAVVRGGAQLLVVQTNNATYMGTGQVEQQFAIARLRAMETRRHVVVAATNGVTGVIAPDGSVVERAPVRTRHVVTTAVPTSTVISPAIVLGPWVTAGLSLLAGAAALGGIVVERRRRRAAGRAGEA